jgi:hypothetical protein
MYLMVLLDRLLVSWVECCFSGSIDNTGINGNDMEKHEMINKLIKILVLSVAIVYTMLSISRCTSINATTERDVFKGSPLASASVYDMSASEYFAETEGYANVIGKQQHYYLYQFTDTSDIQLLTPLISQWIQQNGYTMSKGQLIEDDKELAVSVKTLMKTKNANYSVTILGSDRDLFLYVNIYNTFNDTYDTVFWPLLKTN